MLFAIRDTFIFACSVVIFAIAITDVVVEVVKARQRGESGRGAALREFRTFKVAVAVAFGVILLTRSQL